MLVVKRPSRSPKIFSQSHSWRRFVAVIGMTMLGLLVLVPQVMAHHPFGGTTPNNLVEGFLSGLGHPVIGLDHFAFVVASGLIAIGLRRGFSIPMVFAVATLLGTGIHLQAWDLPASEIVIAGSVVLFGSLIALRHRQATGSVVTTLAFSVIAAFAGLFHGYAYGEAIVGAEMTPMVAYLAGFAGIQLVIALSVYVFGNGIQKRVSKASLPVMRLLGLAIAAIGFTFLVPAMLG